MWKPSLDDMFRDIAVFSDQRKMAVAFAVYAEMTLNEVVCLRWSDSATLNWRAQLLLTRVEASNLTDYVFWEWSSDGVEKLHSLPHMFRAATNNIDWELFSERFRAAIPFEFGSLVGRE